MKILNKNIQNIVYFFLYLLNTNYLAFKLKKKNAAFKSNDFSSKEINFDLEF